MSQNAQLQQLGHTLANATFRQYAGTLLAIEDENGSLTDSFILNEAQLIVYREIERQRKAGRPIRVLILKGRQQGMSTLCQMRLTWRMLTRPGARCLTVGHSLASVHELYGKFDRAIKELPEFLRPAYEPGGERGRRQRFTDPLRSSYRADSAHDPEGVGRGMTIQFAHLTEVPQWSKPDETMQAILATIPDHPETEVLVETTAKGAAGWFYEAWIEAMRDMDKGIEPEFVPVFVPWFKTSRYARKRRAGEPQLDKREAKWRDEHGVTNEQAYWYRDQRKKFGERVTEEYPSTWREAFLASGVSYFQRSAMEFYREHRRDPDRRGQYKVYPGTDTAAFAKDAFGPTHIFEAPIDGHRYVAGIDFASGRAKDNSSIIVIDADTRKVVATHQSKMLPNDVLVEAICLGKTYNTALLVPERNGIGQMAVDRLLDEYNYPTNLPRDGPFQGPSPPRRSLRVGHLHGFSQVPVGGNGALRPHQVDRHSRHPRGGGDGHVRVHGRGGRARRCHARCS
jgi:hypothetical protein